MEFQAILIYCYGYHIWSVFCHSLTFLCFMLSYWLLVSILCFMNQQKTDLDANFKKVQKEKHHKVNEELRGTFRTVQWLGLCTFTP